MCNELDQNGAARRKFLMQRGKFAAVPPPTILTLQSLSDQSYATATSGGGHGGKGGGSAGMGAQATLAAAIAGAAMAAAKNTKATRKNSAATSSTGFSDIASRHVDDGRVIHDKPCRCSGRRSCLRRNGEAVGLGLV